MDCHCEGNYVTELSFVTWNNYVLRYIVKLYEKQQHYLRDETNESIDSVFLLKHE